VDGPGYLYERRIYAVKFQKRTIFGMLLPSSFQGFPCACCNSILKKRSDQQFGACSKCQAPFCNDCSNFVEWTLLGRAKLCRWCLARVYPLHKIVPKPSGFEDVEYLEQLDAAFQNSDQLDGWFLSIFLINRKFDFSGIWWIEMTGWRFFASAKWFFERKLKHEFNLVIASMLFNRTKCARIRIPASFGVFYTQFHEDPTNYLFEESRWIVVMHSITFKMLTRMEMMERKSCEAILRVVASQWALKLKNGLGVHIPPKDSEDDY
jgi:hypothetical protein